jgi:diguanylate cyclase (GGDEF)-like protein
VGFLGRFFARKREGQSPDTSQIDILVAQREIALVIGQSSDAEQVIRQTCEVIAPLFGTSPSFQFCSARGRDLAAILTYSAGQAVANGRVASEELVHMAMKQGRLVSASEGEYLTVAAPTDSQTVWTMRTTIDGAPEIKSKLISRYMHCMEELTKFVGLAIRTPELYHKATRDGLTRLGNRQYFNDQLKIFFTTAKRYGDELSIILIDVDHFKNINDTFGHLAGDYVLSEVARVILKQAREHVDQVFRYGGEEMAIILHRTSSGGASILAERIRKRIEETHFRLDGHSITVTVSVGIACLSSHKEPSDLVGAADGALYRAKESGRNRIE